MNVLELFPISNAEILDPTSINQYDTLYEQFATPTRTLQSSNNYFDMQNTFSVPINSLEYKDHQDLDNLLKVRKELYDSMLIDNSSNITLHHNECIELDYIKSAKAKYSSLAKSFLEITNDLHDANDTFEIVSKRISDMKLFINSLESTCKIKSIDLSEESILSLKTNIYEFEKSIVTALERKVNAQNNEKKQIEAKLKFYNEMFSTVQDTNGYRACIICLTREIKSFIVPCGHTFCDECIRKATGKCFVCRKQIQSVNPLFYS